MKEQTLVEMKNKIEALGRVVQQLIHENQNLRTLAIGNMELTKLLPGYDEALEAMKEKQQEKEKELDLGQE